jgi:magnesium chelatase subunit I
MTVETDRASDPQKEPKVKVLPYSRIVGQEQIKLALRIAYVAPQKLGGVLISGHRGTGKSTAVRAFSRMVYDRLPVTLPINATEDRVVGGWQVEKLMEGKTAWQDGLLKEANSSLLYVDEINLLDDHIVNIILDVTSTGVLVVQREGNDRKAENVEFTLVGTMNPEEGGLRPQLLDRFGLMVSVTAESDIPNRVKILNNVLKFEETFADPNSKWWKSALNDNRAELEKLQAAKKRFDRVKISDETLCLCVKVCSKFETQGNRGDYILALAARAHAALDNKLEVRTDDLKAIAPLVLQHRCKEIDRDGWSEKDAQKLEEALASE